MGNNPLADGAMETFQDLAKKQPFGPRGRVRLGFAMDTMFTRPQVLKHAFTEARKSGAHLITSHVTRVSMMDSQSFYHSELLFFKPVGGLARTDLTITSPAFPSDCPA